MTEVELKFDVARNDRERLAVARALSAASPRRVRIDSWYFDTPGGLLARHRMALRLRHSGERWVQCLKSGASGAGGLHARDEWEFERDGPEIDLSLFADTPLARVPGARTLHRKLVPAFHVEMERRAWDIAASGSRLEVALDAGVVRSGARAEEISELEIECLEGDPRHAFDLARQLLDEVALRPSAVTKAQRGYRLFNGAKPRPVKAAKVELAKDARPVDAARAIVAAGLAQLQANEEGVLRSDDPEFIHQARVALRRTRSALRLFRDVIGTERTRIWRDELAQAARALGSARDWDVFATETLPALGDACGDAATRRALARRAATERTRSRRAAREAIASARYARAILDLGAWLARIDEADGAGQDLAGFASRLVRKRHKKLAADLERLGEMSVEERHRVRIAAKRLRYVVEGLAAALPDEKRAREYAKRLARLQDALGRANDAVTGARLLGAIAPPEAIAPRVRERLEAQARGEALELEAIARSIAATERLWRRKHERGEDSPAAPA